MKITKKQLDLIPDEILIELISLGNEQINSSDEMDSWQQRSSDTYNKIFNIIKPKKKVIDMSVLVGSDIDCEFSDNNKNWTSGKLIEIDKIKTASPFIDEINETWLFCRPRMNHWMTYQKNEPWDKCPIPEGFEIEVRHLSSNGCFYNLKTSEYSLNTDFIYSSFGNIHWEDVQAIKILGLADGYRY